VLEIYVDADACPVKDETYKVAARYDLKVWLVSNSWMRSPAKGRIELVLVDDGFDAADDWIAEHASAGDVVITADIPLAARCIEGGARVIGSKGHEFSEESIGDSLARRELSALLRDMGEQTGGPAPLEKRDRSRYLGRLDEVIQAIRRTQARGG
jgi:uncharacterized protein YaiI (UPF0178 family)